MARPVAVGAVLEISYVGRHENQRTLNVFHYGLSALSAGGTVDGDLVVQGASNDQFNTEGEDKFMDEYLQCLSEDFALERIRFQWVSPTRYSFTEELSAFPAGKFTGPALPPNVSGVIGKRNVATGRTNRGSVHMPAVPVAGVEGGLLTEAQTSRYGDFGSIMKSALNITIGSGTGTLSPIIYHSFAPPLSAQFDQYIVMPEARIMRRRTIGVGE